MARIFSRSLAVSLLASLTLLCVTARPAAGVVSLSVQATDSPDPVGPGGLLTYQIQVTNSGDESALDLRVIATIPEDTTFVDSDPDTDPPAGNFVEWSLGSLGAGDQTTVTLRVEVLFPVDIENVIVSSLLVTDADANEATTVSFTGLRPLGVDLSVISLPPGCLGSLFRRYGINFVNGADVPLTGLTLSAEIPPGLILDDLLLDGSCAASLNPPPEPITTCSAASDCDPNQGCVVFWDIGTLGAQSLGSRALNTRVDPNHPVGTTLESSAQLKNPEEVGTDTDETRIEDGACPNLEKLVFPPQGSVDPGGTIQYKLIASNSGRTEAPEAQIEDLVPPGTTFVTGIAPGACGLDPNQPRPEGVLLDGVVRWPLPALMSSDEPVVVCLQLDVDEDISASSVVNTASWNLVFDSVSTPVQPVTALKLTKSANPSPVEVDEQLIYTIRLTNIAEFPVTGVVIMDDLNTDLTPAGCASFDPNATAACEGPNAPDDCKSDLPHQLDPNTGALVWDVGAIGAVAPNEDVTVRFVVNVDNPACAGTTLRNVAQVMDDRLEQATAAIGTRIASEGVKLRLLKRATTGQVRIETGQDVVYRLRVENRDDEALTNVMVTDDLNAVTPPGALQFVSANSSECGGTGPNGTEEGNVVEWFFPTLPPGEQTVCLRATTSSSLTESTLIVNRAQAVDEFGVNSDEDSVSVRVFSDLFNLSLLDLNDPVKRFEPIHYTIFATNEGNVELKDITIKTRFPGGTSLVCLSGSILPPGSCLELDPNSSGVTLERDPAKLGRGRRIIWNIERLGTGVADKVRQMDMIVTVVKPRKTIRAVARGREKTFRSKDKARALTVVEED